MLGTVASEAPTPITTKTREPTSTSQLIPLPSPVPNHSAASTVVERAPSITVRADNLSIGSRILVTPGIRPPDPADVLPRASAVQDYAA
ncbi:hypothetical protein R3P38DRAFT_3231768 [Favolaschia claudopus]|uniref:Uncharacterized protein n=1 Tax=Favolaschia claudopus TaxID=2862362 RepID=A0AAV9ZJZ2_9AGAR